MLELLSGLSAFAGVFALISPKTPIAKKLFNRIGIDNEILIKQNSTYNKVLLFITTSMILLTILSILLYLDYSKFVLIVLYIIMFSGFFTILSICSRIVDKVQKKTEIKKRRFFTSIGNKPIMILLSTMLISLLLLNTAPTIYNSNELSKLYENLQFYDFPLHSLISNKENSKEEFAIKYENIVKLTQKSQLLQDYERYYKEGIEFSCDTTSIGTNHSKVKRDMFLFLCHNFDEDFRQIYLRQFQNSFFGRRAGFSPESYPLNWLIKSTESQSYKLSRLILNIRLILANTYLYLANKTKSVLNALYGVLILSFCYFGSVRIYKYNRKYDKETTSPKFIFYSIYSLISMLIFIWSILI